MEVRVKAHTMRTKGGQTVQVKEHTAARADSKQLAMDLAQAMVQRKEQPAKPAAKKKSKKNIDPFAPIEGQLSIYDAIEAAGGKKDADAHNKLFETPPEQPKKKKKAPVDPASLPLFQHTHTQTPTASHEGQMNMFDNLAKAARLSLIDSVARTLNDLQKAMVQVKQHQRKTKTGTVVVQQHQRNILTRGERKDMIAAMADRIGTQAGGHVKDVPGHHVHHIARALAKQSGKAVYVSEHPKGGFRVSHSKPKGAHMKVTAEGTRISHSDGDTMRHVDVSHAEARKIMRKADKKKPQKEQNQKPANEDGISKYDPDVSRVPFGKDPMFERNRMTHEEKIAEAIQLATPKAKNVTGKKAAQESREKTRAAKVDTSAPDHHLTLEQYAERNMADVMERYGTSDYTRQEIRESYGPNSPQIQQQYRDILTAAAKRGETIPANVLSKLPDGQVYELMGMHENAIPHAYSVPEKKIMTVDPKQERERQKREQQAAKQKAKDEQDRLKARARKEAKAEKEKGRASQQKAEKEAQESAAKFREAAQAENRKMQERGWAGDRREYEKTLTKIANQRTGSVHSSMARHDLEQEAKLGISIASEQEKPVLRDRSRAMIHEDFGSLMPSYAKATIDGKPAYTNGQFVLQMKDMPEASVKELAGAPNAGAVVKTKDATPVKPIGWHHDSSAAETKIWMSDGSAINQGIYNHIMARFPDASWSRQSDGHLLVTHKGEPIGTVVNSRLNSTEPLPRGIAQLMKDHKAHETMAEVVRSLEPGTWVRDSADDSSVNIVRHNKKTATVYHDLHGEIEIPYQNPDGTSRLRVNAIQLENWKAQQNFKRNLENLPKKPAAAFHRDAVTIVHPDDEHGYIRHVVRPWSTVRYGAHGLLTGTVTGWDKKKQTVTIKTSGGAEIEKDWSQIRPENDGDYQPIPKDEWRYGMDSMLNYH